MKRFDIITIGSATLDVFLKSRAILPHKDEHYLRGEALCFDLGSKNEIEKIYLATGGGATNAAVAFSRQGFRSACISRIGSDEFGEEIIRKLKQEKVNTSFIQKDKRPESGYSTIITTTNGSRVVLVRRGVANKISAKEIPFSQITTKWFYISSLGGSTALLKKIFSFAEKNNIKIAFNPGHNELELGLKKLEWFIKKSDIFLLNQDEAAELTKINFQKEKEILKRLSERCKDILIMTKGKDGVSVVANNKLYLAGIPKSPIVERTGAGDAFGSGFLSGILHSKGDIEYAIQLATANATSVVQYYSAKTGLLKKGDFGKYKKVKVKVLSFNKS